MGLGYAGFPIAHLFSKKFAIVGYDVSKTRIAELNSAFDKCGEANSEEVREMISRGAVFTSDLDVLRECNFYVVVVPTPVDNYNHPDFSFVKKASSEIGRVIKKGDVVVFESTVYPGATEEICVPILESVSSLRCNSDFYVGYSPERINPGDKLHCLGNMVKVTSGSTPEAAAYIDKVYASALGEGNTWRASSIKVAEACKLIENTQRDINIAFMNEVAQIMTALDIDTNEVIEAMNTKWNALGFRPGLVGGHCISVDPYYLIARAGMRGVAASFTSMARTINNAMPGFVVEQVVREMNNRFDTDLSNRRILLMGFTFKENCPDIRNSRVYDIYTLLQAYTDHITVYDPIADPDLVKRTYGIEIENDISKLVDGGYDTIVVSVAHDEFRSFDYARYRKPSSIVYDVKGCLGEIVADALKL